VLVGRRNEAPHFRFRSDRMFHSNGLWYFATREDVNVGPFATRYEAEMAARELIDVLATGADEARTRGAIIDAQTAAVLATDAPAQVAPAS